MTIWYLIIFLHFPTMTYGYYEGPFDSQQECVDAGKLRETIYQRKMDVETYCQSKEVTR